MTGRVDDDDDEAARATDRETMVRQQLEARGVAHAAVLEAMRAVPRHLFVGERDRDLAYGDHPLPIGFGQTISQPYMVARMVELAAPKVSDRVLEVGAGSGYQTAVLARLCAHVYAVEIVPELARRAEARLRELGIENATVFAGDGSLGWPEKAPFDAIVVAAGAPALPEPLIEQLAEGGRLVIPIGPSRGLQVLKVYCRRAGAVTCFDDTACRFVDLQGRHGWNDHLPL